MPKLPDSPAGAWTLSDPGLPPLTDGRKPTPAPTERERRAAHSAAVRWLAGCQGAAERGRQARRRGAEVPDARLLGARRQLARAIRAHDVRDRRLRAALRDRALLIEVAESAAEVGALLVEVEALGLRLDVT